MGRQTYKPADKKTILTGFRVEGRQSRWNLIRQEVAYKRTSFLRLKDPATSRVRQAKLAKDRRWKSSTG